MQFPQLTAAFLLQLVTLINASPILGEAVSAVETRQDLGAINACYQSVTVAANACYSGCAVNAGCYASW